MTYIYFAGRNSKEILRDPLSSSLRGITRCVYHPVFFDIRNAPVEVFQPVNIVPGLTVFGTFITMFLGMLTAKTSSSS